MWNVLIFIILLPFSTNAVLLKNPKPSPWNETWVDRLRHNLLNKYDKFSRPVQHNDTITLLVYLNVMHVEVDSKKNILSVNTWVRMTWNDEKLKWDPIKYGGIDEVPLSIHEVWQPDLYLYNSALHDLDNYESRHCIVRYDGEVTWIAPTVFHSYCEFNLVLWPFETNTCQLDIGSVSHNGDQLNIRLQYEGFDYYSAGEWKLQNVTAHRSVKIYSCCPEPHYMLVYEFKLMRSSELYYHVVFVATIPIVFLVLLTFWLRPQSETKLILNICAVIIDILILLYFGHKIPARVDNIPLIVRFFSGCLCQMTISIIISCFVIHISASFYDVAVPRWIRNLLYGRVRKYLGLQSILNEIETEKLAELQIVHEVQPVSLRNSDISIHGLDDSDQQCMISQSKKIIRLEWILLATAVDRICFFLFCVIFMIVAMFCIRVNSDAFSKRLDIINIPESATGNITNLDYF